MKKCDISYVSMHRLQNAADALDVFMTENGQNCSEEKSAANHDVPSMSTCPNFDIPSTPT